MRRRIPRVGMQYVNPDPTPERLYKAIEKAHAGIPTHSAKRVTRADLDRLFASQHQKDLMHVTVFFSDENGDLDPTWRDSSVKQIQLPGQRQPKVLHPYTFNVPLGKLLRDARRGDLASVVIAASGGMLDEKTYIEHAEGVTIWRSPV